MVVEFQKATLFWKVMDVHVGLMLSSENINVLPLYHCVLHCEAHTIYHILELYGCEVCVCGGRGGGRA